MECSHAPFPTVLICAFQFIKVCSHILPCLKLAFTMEYCQAELQAPNLDPLKLPRLAFLLFSHLSWDSGQPSVVAPCLLSALIHGVRTADISTSFAKV